MCSIDLFFTFSRNHNLDILQKVFPIVMPDFVASLAFLDERIEVGGYSFWGVGGFVTNLSFAKRGKVNAYRGMGFDILSKKCKFVGMICY